MFGRISLEKQLEQMRRDWDDRARKNARFYVNSERPHWNDEEFYASGEQEVRHYIRSDIDNICRGANPREMRVLEIGCGVGRVTRALSNLFGEVHALDVSGEMIAQARTALAGRANVHLYQNNGHDLSVLPALTFDFAYSSIVFQHIPSRKIIENYIREVHRVLKPGALFKFQVQGNTELKSDPSDTWRGAPISQQQAREMAQATNFEMRYDHGSGQQYYWLWFFKQPSPNV